MFITIEAKKVIERLRQMRQRSEPDSMAMKAAFTRIGLLITSRAKVNILRQRLIDTGNLRRSIDYRFVRDPDGSAIEVGSFGVKYAAVHEYGFRGVVSVPSHQRISTLGKSYTVRSHRRKMNIRKRPYLRPAVLESREEILKILRSTISEGK